MKLTKSQLAKIINEERQALLEQEIKKICEKHNIYYPDGSMLQESIFEGQDLTKEDNDISLYFYEERNLLSDNILSLGLRFQDLDQKNILLPSISFLVKGNNNYNYRASYSRGYRNPSIKERYYEYKN